jgi:hypothetical protein
MSGMLENMVLRSVINLYANILKYLTCQKTQHARPDMIKELHLGANVLLAHFHYGCKGHRPFTLDWNPELSTSMAKLDDKQLRFVRQTAVYVEYTGQYRPPNLFLFDLGPDCRRTSL